MTGITRKKPDTRKIERYRDGYEKNLIKFFTLTWNAGNLDKAIAREATPKLVRDGPASGEQKSSQREENSAGTKWANLASNMVWV